MTTPTASSSQAKATNLHNVATPQAQVHLPTFTSPAPRSVPSPAAQRTQAGKSPFTALTHAQNSSSTMAHNYPTVGSSGSASKALLGSSPAAAMMNFESPMGMSFSLSQLGGLDGGVPMAAGLSGFSGLGLLEMGSISDEEKWRRLQEVMDKLKSRPGRVSPENIKALGERLEMDPMLDKVNGRVEIALAGRNVLVDVSTPVSDEFLKLTRLLIKFNDSKEVTDVELAFTESSSQAVQDMGPAASKVFYDSLVASPGQSSMSNMLDRFAANLEKLGKIDRPNGAASDNFNCFEAIAGVYKSLHKLYDYERGLAMRLYDGLPDAEKKATDEVTTKKSGRPKMNQGGFFGLNVDYWINHRHLPSGISKKGEIRSPRNINREEGMPSEDSLQHDIYSLSIHCEPTQPGQMTQPARISDEWISDQIEQQPIDEQMTALPTILDWLEPPPTYVAPGDAASAAMQSAGKVPNVRFVARLQPPLLLPSNLAIQGGITSDSTFEALPSYIVSLLLHHSSPDASKAAAPLLPKELQAQRKVLVNDGSTKTHTNTLRVRNYDQGILLHDIPFEHPKQLIQLLPLLRQFAFLNNLLTQSFPGLMYGPLKSSEHSGSHSQPHDIDITLWTSPNPKMSLTFSSDTASLRNSTLNEASDLDNFFSDDLPTSGKQSPFSVTVSVLPNADVTVSSSNIPLKPSAEAVEGVVADRDGLYARLARALDITEDLDLWVEFAKHEVTKA